jgi:hypothetical protein
MHDHCSTSTCCEHLDNQERPAPCLLTPCTHHSRCDPACTTLYLPDSGFFQKNQECSTCSRQLHVIRCLHNLGICIINTYQPMCPRVCQQLYRMCPAGSALRSQRKEPQMHVHGQLPDKAAPHTTTTLQPTPTGTNSGTQTVAAFKHDPLEYSAAVLQDPRRTCWFTARPAGAVSAVLPSTVARPARCLTGNSIRMCASGSLQQQLPHQGPTRVLSQHGTSST